jgi:DNA polymerase III gamma/tau subunit
MILIPEGFMLLQTMSQKPSAQTITNPSKNNAPMNSNPPQSTPPADANDPPAPESQHPPAPDQDSEPLNLSRTPSQSSHNTSSTHSTIDSTLKITPAEESWSTATTNDLMNFEQYKERHAQAAHWKACKLDLKRHVARMKDHATARKFEMEIKVIGRR